MKKDLIIEMEEECITCPNLSLETKRLYADGSAYCIIHECEHLGFCKEVRQNWERYHNQKED